MTNTATTVLEQALNLPERNVPRSQLVCSRASMTATREDVDAAWAQEIDRRCEALDKGEAVTTDWREFRAQIERDVFHR